MEEKRKHARQVYKGAKVLCYSSEDPRGANPYNFATHLVDVGLGGVCILSVGRLRPEIKMIVDIFFQQYAGGLKAPARVCWSKEVEHKGKMLFMTGLEFLTKPEFTGRALDAVLGRDSKRLETVVRQKPVNRRIARRVRVDATEITVTPNGLLAGMFGSNIGRSVIDLSSTGARISTKESLQIGQPVRLKVRIPRVGDIVSAKGVVRWCVVDPYASKKDRYFAGIKFTEVDAASKSILSGLERYYSEDAT